MKLGITGHQGLPPATVELVRADVQRLLATFAPVVGVTMLGPGADQLVAQQVLQAGGELHVIVPAASYRDGFEDADAQQQYDTLLAQATHVGQLPFTDSNEQAHMAGGQAIVNTCDQLLAVWDGQPSKGLGGTADVVEYARQRGVAVIVVWPAGAKR